jgi:hypothetical protein
MRALGLRAHPGVGFVRPGSTDSHPIEMDGHHRLRPSLAQVFPGPGPPGGLDRGGALYASGPWARGIANWADFIK